MLATWPCPDIDGGAGATAPELALIQDSGRARRVLVVPPLFDEGNRLRAQLADAMRRLDRRGVDSALPDLPGWNESLAPLDRQTLPGWQAALAAAATHFRATHTLTLRTGALIDATGLPGWDYAPAAGRAMLRAMIRARTIAARESGHTETSEALTRQARREGITLAGWPIGAALFAQLEAATPDPAPARVTIAQADLGGPPLWLRAEAATDAAQAEALADLLAAAA